MKDKKRLLSLAIPFVWWGFGHIFYVLFHVEGTIVPYAVIVFIGGALIACIIGLIIGLIQLIKYLFNWIFEKKEIQD